MNILFTNLKKQNIKELKKPFSQFLFFFFRFLTLQAAAPDSFWFFFLTNCEKKGNGVRVVSVAKENHLLLVIFVCFLHQKTKDVVHVKN